MKPPEISTQEELAFSAVQAHALFPGRATLYVGDVARALHISENQVINLIEGSELRAVNIASAVMQKDWADGGKTVPRAYWRIPVSAFDEFIERRKNT
jgi:hypothetical protein